MFDVTVFVVQLTRQSRGLTLIMFLRDLISHMMTKQPLLLLNSVSDVMLLTCTVGSSSWSNSVKSYSTDLRKVVITSLFVTLVMADVPVHTISAVDSSNGN